MSLWTRHDVLNHHVTRYTRSTLESLAHRSGLRIERSRYLFQWTAAAKLATRAIEAVVPGEPASPRIPPGPINGLLRLVTLLEERILAPLHPSFGSSYLAVMRP